MAEYIRREDAIKCIEGQCVDGKMWGNDESDGTLIEAYSAIDDLMEIPPADVAPVRHARWVDNHCTACGMMPMGDEMWKHCDFDPPNFEKFMDYCPSCGAKMDRGNCRSYNKPKTGWCEVHLDREHMDDFCSYGERKEV